MNKVKFRLQQNSILALVMVIGLFVFAGLSFDFYYDLNDDVMIKDIVSGAYTGTPDAHSIQMLYPISLIISLLYRVIPALPWQGIFLCACHGVCFYLIAGRSLSFVQKTWKKAALLVVEASLILALFIWELVIVQYTITAALLAAAACFLVLTSETEEDDSAVVFWKKQIVPMILVLLAFNVRSEMLLLMSPFIAAVGVFKWSEEKKIFSASALKKYLGMIGIILVGMAASLLIDFTAYGSGEWREFRDFFNARTQVYDYTWYPDYDEAESFYQEMGVSRPEYTLLDNYNFGLDEAIDAELLWSIAKYQEETDIEQPFSMQLKEAFTAYKWRTLHEDNPYSYMIVLAYVLVAFLAFWKKDWSILWKIPTLVVFRTIPWLYVILADRVPNRISHPLYYIELIVLCAWILGYCRQHQEKDKWIGFLCGGVLAVYAFVNIPSAYVDTQDEMARRESVNKIMEDFDIYAKSNAENYYYMDVYSTVTFSEKMFEDVDNSQKNYDLLGGWVSGSPLQKKATLPYHNEFLSEAELLLKDNFYFVIEKNRDLQFLHDYYGTQGITLNTELIEEIGNNENPLQVYAVSAEGF